MPTHFLRFMTLSLVLALTACDSSTAPVSGDAAPVEVGIVTLATSDVALVADVPGRTAAYRRAEVRPQVNGIIERRLFEEGAEVEAGDELYHIDDSLYRAALAVAKAELARAEANLTAARAREERYRNLVENKAISRQDYDDAVASLGQARASVAAGKAAVETANVNLKYTRVTAPISGIISRSAVTEGALVTAGQAEVLTTIQQLDPIYVDVAQSVDELLALRRQMLSGDLTRSDEARVRLILNDGSVYEHEGKLQFAEVGVSESTGSVTLRALFPNPDRLLLPGMFVRTELMEGTRVAAMLVPQRGVTRDRSGQGTALIVNSDNQVEQRALRTSRAVGDHWLVEEGLAVGDRVIVEGLQKIKPGAAVTPVPAQSTQTKAEGK